MPLCHAERSPEPFLPPLISTMISPMNSRPIALPLLLTLLAACGRTSDTCTEKVWTGEFGLCIGEGWEQLPDGALKEEGIPMETIAAFHRTDAAGGQRDNIVVSMETLPGNVPALAYAEANIKVIEAVPDYALLEKREVKIDGEVTILHMFTARPVADLPVRRFYQLSVVKGAKGFTFTGTLPFSTDDAAEKTITDMLLSVTMEKGEESE